MWEWFWSADICGVISLFSDLFVQSSDYSLVFIRVFISSLLGIASIHLISSLLGIAISFRLQSLPVISSQFPSQFSIVTTEATLLFPSSVSISLSLVSVAFSPFLLSVIINITFFHSCSCIWSHHFLGSIHCHLFHLLLLVVTEASLFLYSLPVVSVAFSPFLL